MRINDFVEIVHCLNCSKSGLKVSDDSNDLLCENCGQRYNLKNGVPVFIPNNETEKHTESELHKNQGTNFRYIDHYQKDGIEHDYFQERDAGTEHSDRRVHEHIFSNIKKIPVEF